MTLCLYEVSIVSNVHYVLLQLKLLNSTFDSLSHICFVSSESAGFSWRMQAYTLHVLHTKKEHVSIPN